MKFHREEEPQTGYRCPNCGKTQLREIEPVTTLGWIVVAITFFPCFPIAILAFILMRKKVTVCSACGGSMQRYEIG